MSELSIPLPCSYFPEQTLLYTPTAIANMNEPDKDPITVNKILGKQASFGPIPAHQLLPWFAIITLSYFIFDGVLGWGIPKVAVISFWLIVSWWFLTGQDPDQYINRFRKPRGRNWVSGGAIYVSPLLSRRTRINLKKDR